MGWSFQKRAIDRLSERNIDIYSGNTLERLNKAVELAEQKGSSDTLVIVDSNAFVVSVKNNKVITTMRQEICRVTFLPISTQRLLCSRMLNRIMDWTERKFFRPDD